MFIVIQNHKYFTDTHEMVKKAIAIGVWCTFNRHSCYTTPIYADNCLTIVVLVQQDINRVTQLAAKRCVPSFPKQVSQRDPTKILRSFAIARTS